MVNVGTINLLLFPHTNLGALGRAQAVSLPVVVTEVKPVTAAVSSQAAAGVVRGGLEACGPVCSDRARIDGHA